jgi:hypothetical protein
MKLKDLIRLNERLNPLSAKEAINMLQAAETLSADDYLFVVSKSWSQRWGLDVIRNANAKFKGKLGKVGLEQISGYQKTADGRAITNWPSA